MKADQKNEPLLELELGALSLVTGGAGKNVEFRIFGNDHQYSGATPKNFLRKHRR
jgi:hypothetical protein